MIMKSVSIVVILCFAGASLAQECREPWDSLEYGYKPLNVARRLAKRGANVLPRNITVPDGASCVNQVDNATYYGIRQQVAGDASNNIVALYDKNGIIAGIQVRFNKSALFDGWDNQFRYDLIPMFQTEEAPKATYLVLTAYFVEPSTICSEGRSLADLASVHGTGYTLLFQDGPTPDDLFIAPRRRTEALDVGYSNNGCFMGMGQHTLYDVESYQETNCNEIIPVFLLQNSEEDGCLVGFGFTIVGSAVSDILEQPRSLAVESMLGSGHVPQCLNDLAERKLITTIHIFFTRRSIGCSDVAGEEFIN